MLNLGAYGIAYNDHHEQHEMRAHYTTTDDVFERLDEYEQFLEDSARIVSGKMIEENVAKKVAAKKMRMFCEAFKEDTGRRLSKKDYENLTEHTTGKEMAEILYTKEQRRILNKSHYVLIKHVPKENKSCRMPKEPAEFTYENFDKRQAGILIFIPQKCSLSTIVTMGTTKTLYCVDKKILKSGFNYVHFDGKPESVELMTSKACEKMLMDLIIRMRSRKITVV